MQHQQFKYYLNGINITYDTMIFFSQGLSEKLNMNSFIGLFLCSPGGCGKNRQFSALILGKLSISTVLIN